MANDFILRAQKFAREKIVMLLKLDYLHGGERFDAIYRGSDFGLSRVVTYVRRPWLGGPPQRCPLNGQFSYAWFEFTRGYCEEWWQGIQIDNRSEKTKIKAANRRSQLEFV